MADLAQLYSAHLDVVRERFDHALAESDFDHVLIYAGEQRYMFLDDMPYPFKVNPHFKTWVPLVDNPHCFLVYTPGSKPLLVFHQPVDYWHKPAETPTGFWVEHFDVKTIASPAEAKQYFPTSGRTAYLGESDETHGAESNPERLMSRLHFERAWKTEYELECMRRANELGARGHRAAEQAFREGHSEFEIHLAYLRATSHVDEELPYGNIIALNEHASVLHYQQHDRHRFPESERWSFLIDAGASFHGYASDITRTYSQRKDEFQELIDAMDNAQQAICAAVVPGVNYPDLHMLAHRHVAQMLASLDFVQLDVDSILEKRISSTFLPHGVGHLIGLQVHDVGGFMADRHGTTIDKPEGHPYLRLTRRIETKQVFTIEPGFYFIESLLAELRKSDDAKYVNWTKVDSFRKFGGIRIEDDLAVTETGHENLTRDAFARIG